MPSPFPDESSSLASLVERTVELMRHDGPGALTLAESAVKKARRQAEPQPLAQALRIRAMAQGSTGNITAALEDFEAALPLAQRADDTLLISQCLHGKAVALKHQGAYATAITTLDEAILLARKAGNERALRLSLIAQAACHGSLSNYGEAINCLTEARELTQEAFIDEQGQLLGNIAMVYFESGQLGEALRYFEEAVSTDALTPHASYHCHTLISYSQALRAAGQQERAVRAAEDALKLAYQQHNQALEATALVALGEALVHTTHAETTLQAAHRLAQKLGLPEPLFSSTRALGTFYVAQNKAPLGIPWLQQALTLAEASERLFLQSELHQTLSAAYEQQGELALALEHYQRFHALYAQLHQESAKNRMQSQLARKEAERARQETEQLRQQVLEDPLTQLYNRRFLNQFLEREIARSRRNALPLSVILLDIDNFKQVNDQHSHRLGDQVLLAFATLLRLSSRQSDVLVRPSGDEFILIAPETTLPDAQTLAERLRRVVAEHPWETLAPGLVLTASIGVVDLLHNDSEDLLDRADQRLYQAKRSGKNQVAA